MKTKKLIPVLAIVALLILLAAFSPNDSPSAQSSSPTQTPYIVYVVVTATPEPTSEITIVNDSSKEISIVNEESDVAIVTDNTDASVTKSSPALSMELVSEPTYGPGVSVPYGQVFSKQWLIRNTGTETWTTDYRFVFNSGWQIGNTYFNLTRDVAPGDTYTVTLWMTPNLDPGEDYFSTYALTSPNDEIVGYITSSFTVVGEFYYSATAIPWSPYNPNSWFWGQWPPNWNGGPGYPPPPPRP